MGVLHSLSDLSLDDLITCAQFEPTNNSRAMNEILSRFSAEIDFAARSAVPDWHLRQDAAQGARLALVRAVRNHTAGTIGFRSYARLYMRHEARRAAMGMVSDEMSQSTELLELSSSRHAVAQPTEEVTSFAIQDVIGSLSPIQQRVVLERYVLDRSLADIAGNLGVSVSAVSQRLKTIHRSLRPTLCAAVMAA